MPVSTTPGATLFLCCRALVQRPRAWPPLSRPVNTISGATLFVECRALTQRPSRPGGSASARVASGTVLTQKRKAVSACVVAVAVEPPL